MPKRRVGATMVDDREDPKTFYSKDMAGKGSLDDEMLPNQGEPVPQAPDPETGGRAGLGAERPGQSLGEESRSFEQSDMAGTPPLDDEMLPNRGEPVDQSQSSLGGSSMMGGEERSMEGSRIAGTPPLDDEMLPNRGQPVPQNGAAQSEVRDPLMKGDSGFSALRADLDARKENEPVPAQKAMDPYSFGPGDTGGGRDTLAGSRNKDQGDVGRDHLWSSGQTIKGRHHGRGDED